MHVRKFLPLAAVVFGALIAAPAQAQFAVPFSNFDLQDSLDAADNTVNPANGGFTVFGAGSSAATLGGQTVGGAITLGTGTDGEVGFVTAASPVISPFSTGEGTFSFDFTGEGGELDVFFAQVNGETSAAAIFDGISLVATDLAFDTESSVGGTFSGDFSGLVAGEQYVFVGVNGTSDIGAAFTVSNAQVEFVPFEQDVALGAAVVGGFIAFRKFRKAKAAA